MEEINGKVFVIATLIRPDNPADNFFSLEVFGNQEEADFALSRMVVAGLEPDFFWQDRIEFEGQLPQARATAPVRLFVVRWDLPGHPGEAELFDHLGHLEHSITDQDRVNLAAGRGYV